MSLMEPITKAEKRLTEDENVKAAFALVKNTDQGMAAMEIALMELAVMKLHANRAEIEAGTKEKLDEKKAETKKFYRAVAKSVLVGKMSPEKAQEVLSKHLGGPDGTDDHPSGTSQDIHSGGSESERDLDFSGFSVGGPKDKTLQRPGQATRAALNFVDDDKVQGAMRSYLSETTIGSGVIAVADYFSRTGSKLQFAARAIAEFGPIVGVRMAHSYFRYGGYDVPMKQKGEGVVTEMGDRLPDPESAKKTRGWAIETLKKRLPGRSADDANAEPPSEGFVIDSKGNVLAHGVGRGNDHFLPFNSRHLKKMRQEEGVEYVRRRMFGGPTSEDLHAAMLMGADRVTVVSNGGTFTIELSGRSHGIKMEHGQILSRFQDILDSKGNLDFRSYNSALDSLQAEFPLHFRKAHAEKGEWGDDHDRIAPKVRFRDQLKNLFDVLGGKDSSDSNRTNNQGQGQGAQRKGLPGLRTGENTKQWYQRMSSQGSMSKEQAFNLAVARIRDTGGDINSQWIRDERQRIMAARNKGSGPGGGVFSQRESSSNVRTPSTTADWGQVSTRRADPAQQAAQRAQPQQSASFTMPQRARERFEALGLDPKGFSTENTAHARELAQVANSLPARSWEDALDDGDFLRDLTRTFNSITSR